MRQLGKTLKCLALGCSAITFLYGGVVSASPVVLEGLTFSDELGGFEITGGSGTGSLADPFIIEENVTSLEAILAIRGLTEDFGNRAESLYLTGFAVQKVVTNNTGATWNFFDHELQEVLGVPSSEGDGLSFAQASPDPVRPFTSDKFSAVDEITDVRDFVNFSNGTVAPGETVTFNYVITDASPTSLFYLRQRPNFRPGQSVPEPATLLLLGGGLAGLGYLHRRSKRG